VLVLEEESSIGQGVSSRSSEVIHAGLYYPKGSLKAECCVPGKEQLYRYCKTKGIRFSSTGKLIVASSEQQLERLKNLQTNAVACGVTDLEIIGKEHLNELEPEVDAQAALLSPSTGIVDSHELMLALRADVEDANGMILTNTRVAGGHPDSNKIQLQVISGGETRLQADQVINCSGLCATETARSIPDVPDECIPRTWFVKGHYFSYSDPSPFSRLIYPLPDVDGLGVHATLDLAGQLRFGPDARYCKEVEFNFEEGKKQEFAKSIRRWYPALDESKLQSAYVGIRPKLSAPGEGFKDFQISGPGHHKIPGLVNLFGIESPGLTSCLALADKVRDILI
jgi:L-2-hydroxyglutarate oxidase LhgO